MFIYKTIDLTITKENLAKVQGEYKYCVSITLRQSFYQFPGAVNNSVSDII